MSEELHTLQRAVAGRFAVEQEVGRGGMGIVFLAHDLALDRPVAIKLLAPALAAQPRFRSRFVSEARAAARLLHPNIVPVHAVEADDQAAFIVMGYIEGETLGDRVRRAGPLERGEAHRVARDVAWALGHAHAHGVIHRDVKPDNVLLESGGGRVLVADFGIARFTSEEPGAGDLAGTPQYMSPEQAEGRPGDQRSDLYALGATIWFALTGRAPIEGETARDVLLAKLQQDPGSILAHRPDLPSGFASAIDRCLTRDPALRPESADALLELLDAARVPALRTPEPVAAFVRQARGAIGDIASAWIASAVSIAVYLAMFSDNGFAQLAFFPITALLFGIGLARVGEIFLRTRQLLYQGYRHPAVALELVDQEREEQILASFEQAAPKGFMDRPGWVLLLGLLKTAPAVWLITLDSNTAIAVGIIAAILIPTMTLRRLWQLARPTRGLGLRLVAGWLGRVLFRLAGLGLRGRGRLAPNAPTALLLGDAATRLFDDLTPEERRRLDALPGLLRRLQSEALRPGTGGLDEERRRTALAALETIRLDLLRLRDGQPLSGELTRDLDAVQRFAESVDRLLATPDPTPS